MSSQDDKTYTIEPIAGEDTDKVLVLLKQTFYIDEPMNKAIGLYDSGSCPELDKYCTDSLLEGLSFKAIDKDRNIVGVMVSGVYPLKEDTNGNDLLSQARRCKNPKFQKILYVLAQREEGARLWEKYSEEKYLVEVKVAATDPRWRRRGIMNNLLAQTEKAVKSRDMRILRMDTSSAYSAKSAEHLGFTKVFHCLYTDIKLEGKPIIVPEPPHVEDCVYIKLLDNK